MRAVLVDDHPMFRMGLRMMLRSIEDIDIVGNAEDGEEALRVCADGRLDVVLMDLGCPDERASPRRCGFIATYDAMSCTPRLK
jgi:DNA-binding NarL/FixJ family response regulator